MARNPLDDDEGGGGNLNSGGKMRPGETRTVNVYDATTKQISHTVVIRRTTRSYGYDLRDAYNESLAQRNPDLFNQMEYAVGVNDQIFLRHRRATTGKPESEHYDAPAEDVAAIRAYVAKCMARGMTQEQFNSHVRRTGGCPR